MVSVAEFIRQQKSGRCALYVCGPAPATATTWSVQSTPLLLAAVAREPSDATLFRRMVRRIEASAGASRIGRGSEREPSRAKEGGDTEVSEKSLESEAISGFHLPPN